MREFEERSSGFTIGGFNSGNFGDRNLYRRHHIFEEITNIVLDSQIDERRRRIEEKKKDVGDGFTESERGERREGEIGSANGRPLADP